MRSLLGNEIPSRYDAFFMRDPPTGKGHRRAIVKQFVTIRFYCPHSLASFVVKTSRLGKWLEKRHEAFAETLFKQIT